MICYANKKTKNYSSRLKTNMATAVNRMSTNNKLEVISPAPTTSQATVAAKELVACICKRIECCFVVQRLRVSMHASVHIDKH